VDGGQVFHVDCRRVRALTREERELLFRYCWDHPVAECVKCARTLRHEELASDFLGSKTHLCPQCRTDLTESMRAHIYGCTMLPAEVRRRAVAARDSSRKLVKETHQLGDRADVLMRDAEAAIAALRESMKRAL
jgi:hypothetical protein